MAGTGENNEQQLRIISRQSEADGVVFQKVVSVGQFKIGLCHGHQLVPWGDPEALATLNRQLDCDILISGNLVNYISYTEKYHIISFLN